MRAESTLSWAIIVVGALFLLLRGVVPALTQIDTDFPNYYTAGLIARTGNEPHRLYDDVWFQEQIWNAGFSQSGKFAPFPPPTALLFAPLSYLQPLQSLRAFAVLNLLMLIVAVELLRRLTLLSYRSLGVIVVLSGWGLANCFRFGQLYIALSLSLIAAWYLFRQQKDVLAGICAGMLLPIKYFPAILFIPAVAQKRWAFLLSTLVTTSLIIAISILVLGWEIHLQWVFVALNHLQGKLSQQDPFASAFQSFHSLFRRLFLYDASQNPLPLIDSPVLYAIATYGCTFIAIGLAVLTILRHRKLPTDPDSAFAAICILGLLVAPATATYHFLLLWLPVALLFRHFLDAGKQGLAAGTLACFGLIGFLPYSLFRQFDGQGMLTVLAYPRLWFLCGLYALALLAQRRTGM